MRAEVDYLRLAPVDLPAALAQLRTIHGVRTILCEGGPHLNASLVAAGLVDELFLTSVPALAGAAGELSIVDGAPLDSAVALSLRWLLEHDGELFARYALGERQRPSATRLKIDADSGGRHSCYMPTLSASSDRAVRSVRRRGHLSAAIAIACAATLVAAPTASAVTSVGPGNSPGLAIDEAGTAYIAWNGPEQRARCASAACRAAPRNATPTLRARSRAPGAA